MSRTRIIRDATLARQLKTEAKAQGIANRLSGTLVRHWPEVLRLIPESPNYAWNPSPLRYALALLHEILQRQLERELVAMGQWTGHHAARSLGASYRRHFESETVYERDPSDFNTGDINFGDGRFARKGLVAPPSAFEIARIVGPAPFKLTKLFDVNRVSGRVWQLISEGKNRVEIAKDLQTMLNGDRVACRRVARTEGARVATQVQLATSEQLADEISGYSVIAVPKTEFSRPDHLRRSGTIYWRHPKAGQLGFDKMPQPPIEADGTLSWNCRCQLAPVWRDEPLPQDDGFGRRIDLNGIPIAV